MDVFGFLGKVLIASGLITAVIKFVIPHWPLPATIATSLSLVMLPPLGMGSWLVWQQISRPRQG